MCFLWPLLLFSHLDCLYISGLVCLCLNKMELVMGFEASRREKYKNYTEKAQQQKSSPSLSKNVL